VPRERGAEGAPVGRRVAGVSRAYTGGAPGSEKAAAGGRSRGQNGECAARGARFAKAKGDSVPRRGGAAAAVGRSHAARDRRGGAVHAWPTARGGGGVERLSVLRAGLVPAKGWPQPAATAAPRVDLGLDGRDEVAEKWSLLLAGGGDVDVGSREDCLDARTDRVEDDASVRLRSEGPRVQRREGRAEPKGARLVAPRRQKRRSDGGSRRSEGRPPSRPR